MPRTSFIATIVAIFLVLAVAATLGGAIWIARSQAIEEWQRQIDNLSLVLSEQTAQEVKSAYMVLDSIAESMQGNDIFTEAHMRAQMSNATWFASLRDKIQGLPQVDVATIAAANGDIINLTRAHPAPAPPINLFDREYFQAHLQQPDLGIYMSAPVRNRSNGQWTFYLSRRLSGPNGEFLGLALVGFSSTVLADFYQKINLGDGATVALYRRDAMLMARWPHDDAVMGRLADKALGTAGGAAFLAGASARTLPPLGASRLIDNFPLAIHVTVTDRLYLAQWRRFSAALALAGAISVVAIMAAFVVLIRSLRRREHDMEEMRALKSAAEAASGAKSAFLAMMSHEIRTPLTSIIGFADMMGKNEVALERGEAAAVIARNGHHLLDIINDILDISKIEAGRLQFEQVPFAPLDVANSVAVTMAAEAAARQLDFTVTVAPRLPSAVLGDATRFRQILFNLCGNAVKFTEHGSVQLALAYDEAQAHLICRVTDTGIGMTPEQQAVLFEPFSQAGSAVARQYGGTGLGLHLVRQLSTRMGGGVTVSSAAGRGAVFEVHIVAPLAAGAVWLAPAAGIAPAPLAAAADAGLRLHGHVLVAEDGIDNRRLVGVFLDSLGLTHEAVDNGALALERAASGRFDLVLMDIRMPVLDGVSATESLRAQGFDKPIIALTANLMQEDLARYAAAGFNRSVGKPIDFAELAATLAILLGQTGGAGAGTGAALALAPVIDALAEIRDAFSASLAPRLASLAALVDGGQWSEAAELAHQLRGAGGSFGYPGLSRCARVLEMAADRRDGAASAQALAALMALDELRDVGGAPRRALLA
ncbi:ATP-binding protein [Massilia sp. DWR3-1-1]|uniref:hybrid sensor histidine kinase/response regulator n=1 Tax=Massilia sp. DWR3-1-1 TaxID=2804559 RepID=UPI003CF4E062